MQRELELAHEVVILVLVLILVIVDVVDHGFEHLMLLELVGHLEAGDPLGIQVVVDDLGVADLAPAAASLLVEHHHAVGARERVQVGQVLTSKRQL